MSRGDDPSGSPAKAGSVTPEAVEELRSFLREGLAGWRPQSRALSEPAAPAPAEQHPTARRSSDETDGLLRMRAEHVIRSAGKQASVLIAETRLANERRWAEARSHADEIRLVGEVAAQRGLASAQETNAQSLETAERRARELVESAQAWVSQMLTGVSSLPMAVREMTSSTGEVSRGPDVAWSADVAERLPVSPVAPAPTADALGSPPEVASERAVWSESSEPLVAPPAPTSPVAWQSSPALAAPAERAAEPPAADPAAFTNAPMIGGVELVVGSFARFSQLAAFTRALRALQGIDTVTTNQFYKNVVRLRVRYDGDVPLVTRLKELGEFSPVVVSASPTRIELRIRFREHGVSDGATSA